ncbi:MAG TPA: protein phosphatase 2C domain-containing protein [Gemmatimonadales bacterium]
MTAAAETAVRLDVAGLTDVGRRRKANEDHFVVVSLQKTVSIRLTSLADPRVFDRLRGPEGLLMVVADGVGGRPGGAEASETAVTALVEYIAQAAGCFNQLDVDQEHRFLEQLETAVMEAHRRLLATHGERADGPATTLTMAMLIWPRAYIVHVGDSRAFYLRKGRLRQLTRDQTTGEYMVNVGAWTEEQARTAPLGSTLASALGSEELSPAIGLVDLHPGDSLLLCTDGLTRHVTDERITELLATAGSAEAACRALVDAALEGGGSDNVTVVVARA